MTVIEIYLGGREGAALTPVLDTLLLGARKMMAKAFIGGFSM